MVFKNTRTIPAMLFASGLVISFWSNVNNAEPNVDRVEALAVAAIEPIGNPSPASPGSPVVAAPKKVEPPKLSGEHLPQAKSVDLGEPIQIEHVEDELSAIQTETETDAEPEKEGLIDTPPLVMLGTEVPPLTSTRLSWSPAQSFKGLASSTPVLVVNGAKAGPTLCLTAAVHGDELNGIEIVRRVLYNIDAEDLSGSLIGVPIVNLQGFQRNSRYLPDRRDLNRYFPGYPEGSSAARIAFSFFHEVIEKCTVLVDLHTGSFDRTNLPQLRADLSNPEVVALTEGFGATVVLHSEGAVGTLRRAAVDRGIAAVTVEAGGPMRLQEGAVRHSVKSIHTLLNHLGMVKKSRSWGAREPVYYSSTWVRANTGGILLSAVDLGEHIDQDDLLGTITDPITNVRTEVRSPLVGRILGMALDQVVMPGYAAYHIGISADADKIPFPGSEPPLPPQPHSAPHPTMETIDTAALEVARKEAPEPPDEFPEHD